MSVDYDLICDKCKDIVSICSVGLTGPLLQCDKSLAAFVIRHADCDIRIIDEHQDIDRDKYTEWHLNNWKDLLNN